MTAIWLFLKAIPPKVWLALAVLGLLAAFGGWCYHKGVQSEKAATEAVKAEYGQFVKETQRLGAEATKHAKLQEAADKATKEKADAENKTERDRLTADIERLRKQRAGGSIVPTTASCPGSPQRAGFDRALLDAALRDFIAETEAIAIEGGRATVDLNSAKHWATELK